MSHLNAADLGVSRETYERLSIYVALLLKWNARINLIGRATEEQIWLRHIQDCAQVAPLGPQSGAWADLGAGAGLPGLILAAILKDSAPNAQMTLIESDSRKCAFLVAAAQAMELDVLIENKRIEAVSARYDLITARALAPLTDLLLYAKDRLTKEGWCVFPKGARYTEELETAGKTWEFHHEIRPSVADPNTALLIIRDIERRAT